MKKAVLVCGAGGPTGYLDGHAALWSGSGHGNDCPLLHGKVVHLASLRKIFFKLSPFEAVS
jgi:hypothetical protein